MTTYRINFKQLSAICGRHRLHPAKGKGFWTVHRPWGGPFGTTLVTIPHKKGLAFDTVVFHKLSAMIAQS